MSRHFAQLPDEEKQAAYARTNQRTDTPSVIVEKDFWVCWLLGRIFATPGLDGNCVFKGGTSLSKVFAAIQRFSEDIDLGLSPASLGWNEPLSFDEMLAVLKEAKQTLNHR